MAHDELCSGAGDVEAKRRSQVVDLGANRGDHGLGEADVVMDRVDDERAGLALGGRVEFADVPVGVEGGRAALMWFTQIAVNFLPFSG